MTSLGPWKIGDQQIIIQSPSGQSPQRIIMNQHGKVLLPSQATNQDHAAANPIENSAKN
jgi:hypothetical protein